MNKRKINVALLLLLAVGFSMPVLANVFVYCPETECIFSGCNCNGYFELLDNCCFSCTGIIYSEGCYPGFPPPGGGCMGEPGYLECCGPNMCHPPD
jgi:hypothetical protein